MSIYLALMALFMLLKTRKLALVSISTGLWLEQLASYVLLIVGLVGVYAYLQAAPLLSAMFWRGFTVMFAIFSALQYYMPKIQLLRKEKGGTAVAVAYAVGVLLLMPMFVASIRYGFMSPALWAWA